ncbi:8236_t:CDS:2 [Funneliformis mosseae]|uniref:DNA topoisomerase (ATP-hydrolyzing) n=1 Tax=Funneliformis mosseae TaxID=27381 RepID=A0A9N9N6J8_FUNMO|nr:8236_t:CDS:2 [Funneliformis mosseae]
MHEDEKVSTHLFAASNYDDEEKKVSGGRNGFGAKLANIYNTEFILETVSNDKNIAKLYDRNRTTNSHYLFRNAVTTPYDLAEC